MIEIGMLISALVIVIVALLVMRIIGIDQLGEKSEGLIHDETKNECKIFRSKMIDDADRKGEKVLLAKAGEFGKGMLASVDYALNKGFSVTVVSGDKTFCKSRERIIEWMGMFPDRFKYYVLNYRPNDHFTIIGQSHLFIEVPHNYDERIKKSLGIYNANDRILNKFYTNFENTIKIAKEANVNFVKAMPCYLDLEKNAS